MKAHTRRERVVAVVHAMTAVALIAQGLGNIGEPSGRGLLAVLPLVGGGLAVASVVRHRRGAHLVPARRDGRRHRRRAGFMNTAAQAASAISSIAFGYIVGYTGNYNAPFVPMVVTLSVGVLLWLKIDPTHQFFDEAEPVLAVPLPEAIAP